MYLNVTFRWICDATDPPVWNGGCVFPAVVVFSRLRDQFPASSLQNLYSSCIQFPSAAIKALCGAALDFHCLADLCSTSVGDGKSPYMLESQLERSVLLWGWLIISCLSKAAGKLKLRSHLTVFNACFITGESPQSIVFIHNYTESTSGGEVTSGSFRAQWGECVWRVSGQKSYHCKQLISWCHPPCCRVQKPLLKMGWPVGGPQHGRRPSAFLLTLVHPHILPPSALSTFTPLSVFS